jgi:hypothetical protein
VVAVEAVAIGRGAEGHGWATASEGKGEREGRGSEGGRGEQISGRRYLLTFRRPLVRTKSRRGAAPAAKEGSVLALQVAMHLAPHHGQGQGQGQHAASISTTKNQQNQRRGENWAKHTQPPNDQGLRMCRVAVYGVP